MDHPDDLSKEELFGWLKDAALNWLAHDGLWFRAAEERFGTVSYTHLTLPTILRV